MKKRFTWVLLVLMLAYIAIVGVSCMSSPKNIGLVDGKLHPCPNSPNCVSSQSEQADKKIDPLKYKGDYLVAKKKLKDVLASLPRTKVVKEEEKYLHAEATTFFFRFVDDCEFLIDDDKKVIHVRSASRVGHSDLGVNRKRVESIREKFQAQ
ncbi:DUF1499 domain-containing protein [Candidatus Uabimicrobium amorphum]|uniref:DUF1499 domain-containing protein n=1 Tax=Uabimicrobium amorphum TaxID=2596890 RepID=A0A5S9IUG0_UABAM|nr:DUF1499 domain-containing protein [Candidatus Uabimicrobium amorphum]BBM87836.1 hypothetical protein UABAM_06251 [Candidatus Uabimicrobium amorphum]